MRFNQLHPRNRLLVYPLPPGHQQLHEAGKLGRNPPYRIFEMRGVPFAGGYVVSDYQGPVSAGKILPPFFVEVFAEG